MTTEAVTSTTEETLAQEEQEAKEFKSLVRTGTLLTIIHQYHHHYNIDDDKEFNSLVRSIIVAVNMINITIAITRSIMMNNKKS